MKAKNTNLYFNGVLTISSIPTCLDNLLDHCLFERLDGVSLFGGERLQFLGCLGQGLEDALSVALKLEILFAKSAIQFCSDVFLETVRYL